RYAVAEAVYVYDCCDERAVRATLRRGEGQTHEVCYLMPELFRRNAERECARDGREYVAPVKGRAQPWSEVFFVRDVKDAERSSALVDVAEHAVVGADECVPLAFDDYRAARRADAGVNDRDVDCARGERLEGCEEHEGRGLYVVRRGLVCDV